MNRPQGPWRALCCEIAARVLACGLALALAVGATAGCGSLRLGADLDLRWQSCGGTIRLIIEPGIEAGEVVELARVECDDMEIARAVCADGALALEYHALPEGRLGVVVSCNGQPVLSVDGTP